MINDEMMKMHGECAEANEEWMNESYTETANGTRKQEKSLAKENKTRITHKTESQKSNHGTQRSKKR